LFAKEASKPKPGASDRAQEQAEWCVGAGIVEKRGIRSGALPFRGATRNSMTAKD